MADSIKIQDLFTDVALNVSINGRYPPTNDGGYAWQVEVDGTALGDGAGSIKFNSLGTLKIRSLQENPVAVRVIWNDGGAAEGAMLYLGDYSGTIYPRSAYAAKFEPNLSLVKLYRIDEFNTIKIGSNIAHTYAAGDATCVFQRSGNDFTAFVNGVQVGTFTDATYPVSGTRLRHGIVPTPYVAGSGRMRSFEILDSVTPAGGGETIPPHDVVRVW